MITRQMKADNTFQEGGKRGQGGKESDRKAAREERKKEKRKNISTPTFTISRSPVFAASSNCFSASVTGEIGSSGGEIQRFSLLKVIFVKIDRRGDEKGSRMTMLVMKVTTKGDVIQFCHIFTLFTVCNIQYCGVAASQHYAICDYLKFLALVISKNCL